MLSVLSLRTPLVLLKTFVFGRLKLLSRDEKNNNMHPLISVFGSNGNITEPSSRVSG